MKLRTWLDPFLAARPIGLLTATLSLALASGLSAQTTFTVNTTDDVDDGTCDGVHCSLREAITAANNTLDGAVIGFNIPGPVPHTIQPTSPLPAIENDIVLDGTTEPDFAGTPVIEVDGSMAGPTNGLDIALSNSTIRGLAINRFEWSGIQINSEVTNILIEGNFIGTDWNGNTAIPNNIGVMVLGPGNTIGGTAPGSGNLISGNQINGVQLHGEYASGNTVQGNLIGTDANGTVALGNGESGIAIHTARNNTIGGTEAGARNILSGNTFGILIATNDANGNIIRGNYIGTDATGSVAIPNLQTGILLWSEGTIIGGAEAGAGNVISGNGFAGIDMGGGSSGATIQGNHIGTNAAGTAALGNDLGIFVNFSPDNIIGGTQSGAGNVISGNTGGGLTVNGLDATGNIIQGNYIGTDVSGTVALESGRALQILDAPGNTIGGTQSGAGNLIAGNGNGILIDGPNASGNFLQGNSIGVDVTGLAPLENGGAAVRLSNGASGNTIGGTASGAGNIIANSRWVGIVLFADAGSQNRIQSNAIFDNSALGIDLGRDTPTPNDEGDSDAGPNGLQNYPVLTSVASSGGAVIRATLNSAPSSSFLLDFFSNTACDGSGFGEGQTPLGTAALTTDPSGSGTVTASFSNVIGTVFTATATDANGNTSEFSLCSDATTLGVSSSPTTRTVTPGQSATYTIDLTAQGGTFEETVGLTCSGAPTGTTCTFTTDELTIAAGGASTTMTVTTVAPSGSGVVVPRRIPWNPSGWSWALLLALPGIALLLRGLRFFGRGARRFETGNRVMTRAGWGAVAAFGALLLILQTSCGKDGTSPPTGGTPAGTYELTVTATWETVQQTATATLVVQ